jgi:hypothetical protein
MQIHRAIPVTAGTVELRDVVVKSGRANAFGAQGDAGVLPVIGSKELVAWRTTHFA